MPTSFCVPSKCASTRRGRNSRQSSFSSARGGRAKIRAALSENVLNISILFGLHVTGVQPYVSLPSPSVLHSPLDGSEAHGVYICHLGISFHLTLLALIFCRHTHCCIPPCASRFHSIFMTQGQMWEWNTIIRQHICINKYKYTYGNESASGKQSELSVCWMCLNFYVFYLPLQYEYFAWFYELKDLSIEYITVTSN